MEVETTLFYCRYTLFTPYLPTAVMPPTTSVVQMNVSGLGKQNINLKVFFRPQLYVRRAVRAGPHPGISCSQPLSIFLLTSQECGKRLQSEALCKVWLKRVPEFTGGHIRKDETTN